MRKHIFIVILSLVGISSFSQNPFPFNQSEHYFGQNIQPYNSIQSIVASNQALFCTVEYIDSSYVQSTGIVKTDLEGNFIHKKRLSPYLVDSYCPPKYSILLSDDSCIVTLSHVFADSTKLEDAWVTKLNQNLDTIWSKKLTLPDSINVAPTQFPFVMPATFKIVQSSTGSYFIFGVSQVFSFSFVWELDSDGVNSEMRILPIETTLIQDVQITNEGGLIAICDIGNLGNSLVALDSNFVLKWNLVVPKIDNERAVESTISSIKNNYIFVMLQRVIVQPNPPNYPQVLKVELDSGTLIWDNCIDTLIDFTAQNPSTYFNTYNLAPLSNGGCILTGMHNYNPCVMQFDSLGNMLSHTYYSGPSSAWSILNTVFIRGKYLYCAGASSGAWLLKTDSLMNPPLGIRSNELTQYQISAFPNPVQDFLNIQMPFDLSTKSRIHIYSIDGRMVKEMSLSETKVNVSDLANGMYYYCIKTEKEFLPGGKFIKI